MVKKTIEQKFVFIECQLTELDNSVFVAMVTNLPRKQRNVQLRFRSLDPYIKLRLHSTHSTSIIYSYSQL